MSIFSLFSKRQKELRGEVPDVYAYDVIPSEFRVQVVHIWHDSLGDRSQYEDRFLGAFGAYKLLAEALCREYGLFLLDESSRYERNWQRSRTKTCAESLRADCTNCKSLSSGK
jgi:hypothetical protein